VLDVESTGFSKKDCIVELGAVEIFVKRIDGAGINEEGRGTGGSVGVRVQRTGRLFQSYIRPNTKVHPLAMKVIFLTSTVHRYLLTVRRRINLRTSSFPISLRPRRFFPPSSPS
jgi:hypothetical protein